MSRELEDSVWDNFLQGTPLGHFEQSSWWARAKHIDGWRPIRMILTLDDQIAGGFQILARDTRFGGVGHIYKGPVVAPEEPALLDFLIELVASASKANHLQALIVQPADESTIEEARLVYHRFLPNYLASVISATLVVDLSGGLDEIKGRMRRATWSQIRQAEERGITIREGGEQDIGTFFSLMAATCERQRTSPSPATESAILEIWRAFHPHDCVRLSFAQFEGKSIAGVLCLCFGQRVVAWKRGWSGEYRERRPNQLLMFEAIEWSHRHGYELFDFGGLSREIAVTLSRGEPLSESQKNSGDFFHLGYGGRPVLFSESQVYIDNSFARFAYKTVGANAWLRALMGNALKSRHSQGFRIGAKREISTAKEDGRRDQDEQFTRQTASGRHG
jgi:lipid II:glycine glycyltransferase (peptidoglycan interpeptide bridge formation enzyme)